MRRLVGAVRLLLVLLAASAPLTGQRGIPTPESVFGFAPGANYKLFTYEESIGYFKKLAAASPYVKLVEAGRTSEGRVMYFALISTPENLSNIDRYREIAQRLAHPQGLPEGVAHQLAREGKAIVHLDGGLHSTEVAGAQQTPLLAYDLVSGAARGSDPHTRTILENVIVMLWPTINPDGQQIVAEWYMKNVGTPYELSPLPRLYQDYVGHDNNRDAYMLNMIESRVLEHTWRQWEPHVIYVQHQSGPFPTRIWLPPFSEPVGANAPYLMAREVNMMGMAIAKGLEERGQIGATHMGTAFDAWYPGYVDYAPNFKNIPAFWTETALYQYATPHTYTIDDFPETMRDLRPRSLYASPWRPGPWRLRDAVDYMETASLSVLEYASKYKESLLFDRYKAGADQIARGRTEPPYAYIVPQQQRDPVAAVELLRRLAFGGLRVSQATAPIAIDDRTYPAGTWVIPTDQEFAAMAREVLDVQHYPDLRQYPGGPPERPYDAAGWTLPMQMGVTVTTASTPLTGEARATMKWLGPAPDVNVKPTPYNLIDSLDAAPFDSVPGIGFNTSAAAAAIVPPPGRMTGAGPVLAVDPAQNNSFRAINRAWQQGATVHLAAGRYLIGGLSERAQTDLVNVLALQAERVPAPGGPGGPGGLGGPGAPAGTAGPSAAAAGARAGLARPILVKQPRIGLYQPWTGSMDEGWTRWLLEQYGFPYVTLHPDDFHAPLAGRVDVIIVANDARLPIAGAPPSGRGGPVRPEYAYALGTDDLQAFEQFIRGGGTLICLNSASLFAIQQLKLPARNVVAGLRPEQFFLRGSIVQVTTDATHPIMVGMPDQAAVFADSSPVFETLEGFKGHVLARYQESGSPLLSGYLIGETYLQGRAAALDVEVDAGHVVLIGFCPEWRDQPFGTFRILFNAALNVR
jgi:hypothetical protein